MYSFEENLPAYMGFPGGSDGEKNPPATQQGRFPGERNSYPF